MSLSSSFNFKNELISCLIQLEKRNLNQGTSGNLSHRYQEGFYITPSGQEYNSMKETDLVWVDFKGQWDQNQKPSSEWRFHKDLYIHNPEIDVILHTHSIFSTALSLHGMEIPACHYMIALFGGDSIRCAPYALFGTEELSLGILKAMKNRKACIIENHGSIVAGKTVKECLNLVVELEVLSQQYLLSLQLGAPKILSSEQMKDVHDQIKKINYGK